MKKLSDILILLRKEKRMTQQELADALKITRSALSMYESGNRIPPDDVKEAIADFFNVDMNYLFGKTPIRNSYRENEWNDEHIYQSLDMDYIRVPLYSSLCCGNGGFVDDNIIEYIPVPSKDLKPNHQYFCQYASGDSMKDAGIFDGDLLVFEKISSIDSGNIGCFCIDENEAVCKKYQEYNGNIILQPMNSNYEPIIIDPLNDNFRCIGKLKKSIKEFK